MRRSQLDPQNAEMRSLRMSGDAIRIARDYGPGPRVLRHTAENSWAAGSATSARDLHHTVEISTARRGYQGN